MRVLVRWHGCVHDISMRLKSKQKGIQTHHAQKGYSPIARPGICTVKYGNNVALRVTVQHG